MRAGPAAAAIANAIARKNIKGDADVYAIRCAFVLAAAVFSSSVFADYVANRIDYFDPGNGAVANFTQLWSTNVKGNALGVASFDGGVTIFGFLYDPQRAIMCACRCPQGSTGLPPSHRQ